MYFLRFILQIKHRYSVPKAACNAVLGGNTQKGKCPCKYCKARFLYSQGRNSFDNRYISEHSLVLSDLQHHKIMIETWHVILKSLHSSAQERETQKENKDISSIKGKKERSWNCETDFERIVHKKGEEEDSAPVERQQYHCERTA